KPEHDGCVLGKRRLENWSAVIGGWSLHSPRGWLPSWELDRHQLGIPQPGGETSYRCPGGWWTGDGCGRRVAVDRKALKRACDRPPGCCSRPGRVRRR